MRIDHRRMKLDLPDGWHARIYEKTGEFASGPILHFANRPLEAVGEGIHTDDRQFRLTGKLGPRDVLGNIVSLPTQPHMLTEGSSFLRLDGPLAVAPADFMPLEGVPTQRATAIRRFILAGRAFRLQLVFGADRPSASLFRETNLVLSTFAASG